MGKENKSTWSTLPKPNNSWVLPDPRYWNTNSLVTWNTLIFRRILIWHFLLYPFSAFSSSASMLKRFHFWGVWETRQMSRTSSKIRVMWSKTGKKNASTDTSQEKGKANTALLVLLLLWAPCTFPPKMEQLSSSAASRAGPSLLPTEAMLKHLWRPSRYFGLGFSIFSSVTSFHLVLVSSCNYWGRSPVSRRLHLSPGIAPHHQAHVAHSVRACSWLSPHRKSRFAHALHWPLLGRFIYCNLRRCYYTPPLDPRSSITACTIIKRSSKNLVKVNDILS